MTWLWMGTVVVLIIDFSVVKRVVVGLKAVCVCRLVYKQTGLELASPTANYDARALYWGLFITLLSLQANNLLPIYFSTC